MSMPAQPPASLEFVMIPQWPKLAWVAVMERDAGPVRICHGPCVEVHPQWCAEAAWAGSFRDGDFDRTELVVGTGVRARGDAVVFVSSGDTLNRLFWHRSRDRQLVSNSLPALLAVADIDLLEDYPYAEAMASIVRGLHSCQREIPSSGGPVRVVHFNNLVLANGEITETPKPASAPEFVDFRTYRDFLFDSARRLGRNARAAERRHRVTPLASLSSGYDSAAATVVAREAGTLECVTILQGRRDLANLLNAGDSGGAVAAQLGMRCTGYTRSRERFPWEDAAWAGMGNVGDINLALFDYPEPVCLLFTGFMGDVLWDRNTVQPAFLHRKDTSGARFGEARLEYGVLLCSPVFWGCRRESQILALAHLAEMRPWTLNNHYDRPVPRRLVEEAGVARQSFALRKRAASFNRRYGRPLARELREDFAGFLRARGARPGSLRDEFLAYLLDGLDYYWLRKLPAPLRVSCKDWGRLPPPSVFFVWANGRRKRRYQTGIDRSRNGAGTAGAGTESVPGVRSRAGPEETIGASRC